MRPVNPETANRANSSLTSLLCKALSSGCENVRKSSAAGSPPVPRLGVGSMSQDLGQELLRALRARFSEEILLGGILDDLAAVHEDHPVRDLAGESHLVRDDHHGHAVPGEA